jgi:hypothetical protein
MVLPQRMELSVRGWLAAALCNDDYAKIFGPADDSQNQISTQQTTP